MLADYHATLTHFAQMYGWDECEPHSDGELYVLRGIKRQEVLTVCQEGDCYHISSAQGELVVPYSGLADALKSIAKGEPAHPTEAPAKTTRRIGHAAFRQHLFNLWGGACAITGVTCPSLLCASHAKPWSVCTDSERIDPYNGLLLEARYDRLFDRGLISFTDAGTILISPSLTSADRLALALSPNLHLRLPLHTQHLPYLQWHRSSVFEHSHQD